MRIDKERGCTCLVLRAFDHGLAGGVIYIVRRVRGRCMDIDITVSEPLCTDRKTRSRTRSWVVVLAAVVGWARPSVWRWLEKGLILP